MTTDDMTKRAPGVHLRSGSSVWQWKIKTPNELRSLYPSEWAHRRSLGTSDLSVANLLAAGLQADWLARFDEQRKTLNPQRVEVVTPEMAKLLADRVSARILGLDEKLRKEPETARLLLEATRPFGLSNGLAIGPYEPPKPVADSTPLDPLEGMPLELLLELGDINEAVNRQTAVEMATQRVAAVLPRVKQEALALGLDFDPEAPGAMDALRECLKAYRKAWQSVTERDSGAVVETPASAISLQSRQGTRLRASAIAHHRFSRSTHLAWHWGIQRPMAPFKWARPRPRLTFRGRLRFFGLSRAGWPRPLLKSYSLSPTQEL